jgi:nucleoside phosphorylase
MNDMKLTILGALPRELSYIIKNLGSTKSPDDGPFPVHVSTTESSQITIVQTGIGIARAVAALKALLERVTPDCIISVGFAGALYQGASAGDMLRGSRFFLFPSAGKESGTSPSSLMASELKLRPLPPFLAENISGIGNLPGGDIITLEEPMKKDAIVEKIPKSLSFPICEMETFGLAELSLERDVPFLAIRSVSDTLDEDVPQELIGVVDEMGQPKLGRLFHAVTTNPALVTDVLRLRRNSEIAAQNLGRVVEELCRGLIRKD